MIYARNKSIHFTHHTAMEFGISHHAVEGLETTRNDKYT